MAAPAFSIQSQNATRLADPALREGLLKYARRRLPPAEVEDLVQNTLTEALVAANAPSDQADFRRWVHGIARHKIADGYRRRERSPIPTPDVDQNAAQASPSTGELKQWIESELPKNQGARRTLHWLLREGDGESLDEIARDADLPAPRVRQRVSRLRRHFHARWLALGAAGLLLLLGAGALSYRALEPVSTEASIAREPLTPLERARILRQNALQQCAAGSYPECIAGLDQARVLDPSGEREAAIESARKAAANSDSQKLSRPLPASAPPVALPDSKPSPKRYAPRKAAPKSNAPSKLAPKPRAPGASLQNKALPSDLGLPSGVVPGHAAPSQEPQMQRL